MGRARTLRRGAMRGAAAAALRAVGAARIERGSERVVLRAEALARAEPADVVGNYLRGWMFYGTPGALLTEHRWEVFPQRAVMTSETARIPRSLRPVVRRGGLEMRFDEDFEAIIEGSRAHREIPWITEEVVDLYRALLRRGLVATMGAYQEGRLVAGMWGLELGRTYGVLSQFHTVPDSGNLMQATLVSQLGDGRRWSAVDLGHLTEGFRQFGAREVPVDAFRSMVLDGLARTGPRTESLQVRDLLPSPPAAR